MEGQQHLSENYLLVTVEVDRQYAEPVEDALLELGALSCTFEDATDTPIHEPEPGKTPLWNAVEITGMFAETTDGELVANLLQGQVEVVQRKNISLKDLQGREWERVWMDDFKPIKINAKLWVVPTFCDPPDATAVNITIDPGLAFGSGTHATTSLCLQWLGKQDLVDRTVIDYGCGSGILAVAAALLGAGRVCAYDIDPQALLATAENAQRNQVADKIKICHSEKELPEASDFIVANILLGPLLTLPSRFAALLKEGGKLGMSGVLADQVASLAAAYAKQFQHCETEIQDQWVLYSTKNQGTIQP